MRIALVTDAWAPQVSGVVRTYENTINALRGLGHIVEVIQPNDFRTVPCPTYPTIPLALFPRARVRQMLEAFEPHAIHIATEGPLGHAARAYCKQRGLRFTSAFHTQFPEYIRARVPVPVSWSYGYLRKFHGLAERTMVPTPSQRDRLMEWDFSGLAVWGRGVDTTVFHPDYEKVLDLPSPVSVYMGRVAVEKNIEAFLSLKLPGTKVVIGDGPDLARLKTTYPDVIFVGAKYGAELAAHVASGDVFVFPSLTDTFGVVLLEAMACGLPVAAFPVTGPVDVVESGVTGVLDEDLGNAVRTALTLDPQGCIEFARTRTWDACSRVFEGHLAPNH